MPAFKRPCSHTIYAAFKRAAIPEVSEGRHWVMTGKWIPYRLFLSQELRLHSGRYHCLLLFSSLDHFCNIRKVIVISEAKQGAETHTEGKDASKENLCMAKKTGFFHFRYWQGISRYITAKWNRAVSILIHTIQLLVPVGGSRCRQRLRHWAQKGSRCCH